ncbi:hypothetical protein GOP47_0016858 [Adiantum capillus-veneris]|uniref:Uncharacterized protein n=1 Tax=Adiantum capillus-veneris TaxID=13818 RepID=A0A9D4ZAQ3_ADICA|nr:hypothetical protein GOP47_0016858 [Adiantum capillus-veneris]
MVKASFQVVKTPSYTSIQRIFPKGAWKDYSSNVMQERNQANAQCWRRHQFRKLVVLLSHQMSLSRNKCSYSRLQTSNLQLVFFTEEYS